MQPSNDLEKQINEVKASQQKHREAEKILQEIKKKLELHAFITNEALKKNDVQLFNRLKNELNVIPYYNELEKIILQQILGLLNPTKETLDKKQYQITNKQYNFSSSKQQFYEEFSATLREPSQFRLYKSMLAQNLIVPGAIEIPYTFFEEFMKFQIQKNPWILVRFQKSPRFEDFPDIFHETIVRSDLITITFSFRKVDRKDKDKENDVVINKITYGLLFDRKGARLNFRKDKGSAFLDIRYHDAIANQETLGLLDLLKKNIDKANLPCNYPSLSLFQFFSATIMEKLEQFWKSGTPVLSRGASEKKGMYEQIIHNVTKKYADDLHASMQMRCSICKKYVKNETFTQKLLPCFAFKVEKNERFPIHQSCKKLTEIGREIEEPRLILTFDVTEEENDVERFFN